MVNAPVLVLNQGYEPHDVCRTRRAIILVLHGKAELVENSRGEIHTVSSSYAIPSVIRLMLGARRPCQERRLTRLEVFARDGFVCQYCGRHTRDLTLDHVVPRSQGGGHHWQNVVSACKHCNRKKGGRTPEEAGMRLLSEIRTPHHYGYHVPHQYFSVYTEWQKYLPLQVRISPEFQLS